MKFTTANKLVVQIELHRGIAYNSMSTIHDMSVCWKKGDNNLQIQAFNGMLETIGCVSP